MAINKSQTSLGTKIVLIVVAVAFVGSFIPLAAGLFTQNNRPSASNQTTSGQGQIDQVNAQFAPQVQFYQTAIASEPTSFTALVGLGNTYLDWAGTLQQASQTSTAAAAAAVNLWLGAKDSYAKALKVKPDDPQVQGDYAVALYQTGDTQGAIVYAEKAVKTKPEFAPVWFNLGLFNRSLNETEAATTAFETYLKLDPNGQQGDAARAKQYLQELQASK